MASSAGASRLEPQPGWPLLHLPPPAQQALVAHLPSQDRCSLRLACRATTQSVDTWTKGLRFTAESLDAVRSGLSSRFPSASTLAITGYMGPDPFGQHTQLLAPIARLMQGSPWRCITSLKLKMLSDEAATLIMAGCPNVQHLELAFAPGSPQQGMEGVLRRACAAMPLQTLSMGTKWLLGDAELAAVAGCSTLTSLRVPVAEASASGWAALLGMRGLASLSVLAPSSVQLLQPAWVPAGVALNFRSMCSLAELELVTFVQELDERVDDAATALISAPYAAMRLPSSLVKLTLHQLPRPSFPLPLLTELVLCDRAVTDLDLARIAAGCGALASLKLNMLQLTTASHAAPLAALTSLTVLNDCFAGSGARCSSVFPALRQLVLECECGLKYIERPGEFFIGASMLELLHSGRRDGNEEIVASVGIDTGVLAQLAALTSLRLCAEPRHVAGVAALANLVKVEWSCGADHHMLDEELQYCFEPAAAPASLRHASFLFCSSEQLEGVHPFALVADAAISWCVRAPGLCLLEWGVNASAAACARMTVLRLCALAASTSIQRVVIDSVWADDALEDMASMLGRSRGLDVCFI